MERRFTSTALAPVTVRQVEGQPTTIDGIGAVFYDGTERTEYELWEDTVERIMPGAFDKAMAEDDVRGLFNHDPNNILGRTSADTMRLSVTDAGLRYEIEPADTQLARDVMTHIARRELTGSSFAFMPTEERWTETKTDDGRTNYVREIVEVRLYDTGPVTFPAYEATSVGVRAEGEMTEARASFEAWRNEQNSEALRRPAAKRARMRLIELDL